MGQQSPPPYNPPPASPPPYNPPPASPPPYGQPPQQAWVPPVAGPAPGVAYASAGARLVAYIVDGVISFLIILVVTIVLGGVMAAGATANSGAVLGTSVLIWFIALFVVSLGYFPWFWAHGGATPGMKMLHIRVVRDVDGGPVTAGQAVLRLIGYWIDDIVFGLPIGYLWILIDARRQGWHDKIASTVVIESR